jgi:hypothetical protein
MCNKKWEALHYRIFFSFLNEINFLNHPKTVFTSVDTHMHEPPLQSFFYRRMSFEDFSRHFTHLDLVHVGPDDWMSEPALHSKQPWRAVLARRRWRSGYNAGGGPSYAGRVHQL